MATTTKRKSKRPNGEMVPLDIVIQAHGYTKTALAKKLDIDESTLNHYITGRFRWKMDHLMKLCELLALNQAAVIRMATQQEERYAHARGK